MYLDATDVASVSAVCKSWHRAASSEQLWQSLCTHQFGEKITQEQQPIQPIQWKSVRAVNYQ